MQNSWNTLKTPYRHPKDTLKTELLYLSANHAQREFIPRWIRVSPTILALGAHSRYIFINRFKQLGSGTGLGWDLLKLERTDHDWQPWRLHGEALLPVRMTWEQRGRDRGIGLSAATGSLSRALSPFSCNFLWQWDGATYVFSEYRMQNTVFNEIVVSDLKL